MRPMSLQTWSQLVSSKPLRRFTEGYSCAECSKFFQNFQQVALASANAANEGLYVCNTLQCNPEHQELVGTFYNGKLLAIEAAGTETPTPSEIKQVSYA